MNSYFNDLAPWEVDAEKRKQKFLRGLQLLTGFGEVDLADEFEADALTSELGGSDLEAYVFALDHVQAQKTRKAAGLPATPLGSGPVHASTIPTDARPRTQVQAPAPSPSDAGAASHPNNAAAESSINDERVETALHRFIGSKRLTVRGSTADKYRDQCQMFIKIISDRPSLLMSDMTPAKMRLYADTLPRLPRKPLLKDTRPLTEIIEGSQSIQRRKILMAAHDCSGASALFQDSETNKVWVHSKVPVLVRR